MKLTNQLKKWVTNNIKNKADTIFYIILCGVFIGGITVVLIRLFIDFRNLNIEMSKDTTETIQLYSIDPEQEIYGKFTLGSGFIQSNEVYAAYQILEDGGKKYFTMDKRITVIYETLIADEKPYAEITKNYVKGIKSIKLYVPEGTIIQNININT